MSKGKSQQFDDSILSLFLGVGNSSELQIVGAIILRTSIVKNHVKIFQQWHNLATKFGWRYNQRREYSFYLSVKDHIERELTCIKSTTLKSIGKPFHESVLDVFDDIADDDQLRMVGAMICKTKIPANQDMIRLRWQQAIKAAGWTFDDSNVVEHCYQEEYPDLSLGEIEALLS